MKKTRVLLIIIILLIVGFFVWWNNGISPVNPEDKSSKTFIIEKGTGIREIANNLKTEEFIKDPVAFFILIKKEGLDGKIQAGTFKLSQGMDAKEIAQALTHGTEDAWVTIPEGMRADEIADTLKEKLPNYQTSWRTKLRSNEGYLFPDTYLFPKDADIDTIISIMRNNFDKQYGSIPATNTKLSKNEIVTLASLVEREARHPQDRPLVASVIENRLDIGMALQLDATVQYAISSIKCPFNADIKPCNWWPKNVSSDDLAINSFYNTYKNPGLPPTPISNPGLASLKAAAEPSRTNYLYYITDRNGINHYAKTLDEQNKNIQKYGL